MDTNPNPLASARSAQKPHPLMQHAQIWQHVSNMPVDELSQNADRTNYVTPILGALAGNPKVTGKDVIKAAAQAAADGKVPPDQAVKFISQMPSDPEQLRPWLRSLYAANLSGIVHMKAALMKNGMPLPGATPDVEPGAPK